MTGYTNFQHSIESTKSLIAMYTELRRLRKLGPRGSLPPGHEDLLWLPRSAVVAAISSLDAYVHAVLYDRIPQVLRQATIPDSLCDAMADIIPIKNGRSFGKVFPLISGKSVHHDLAEQLKATVLAFQSYQTPDKIIFAYKMIGHDAAFSSVSRLWPGPATSETDIKRQLANYVRRRNQIAHEADLDSNGVIRRMQPAYAKKCAAFVENLVSRLDRIVYGHDL